MTGLDDALRKAWPDIDKAARESLGDEWQEGLDDFTSETGLSVPEDVATKARQSLERMIAIGNPGSGE